MTKTNNKPIIFLAFANDRDDNVGYLRNLPDEARRLRDALQPAEQANLCEIVVRSNSTAEDIFKVFQDPKYRNRVAIFHYGGHANGYELLLESADGQSAAADAGGLASFLGQQQGLQLVFLNGCSTQQQTDGLLDANVSVVISTSRLIDDQVASDFSDRFYQGLAGGASIRTAFNESEAAVQTKKGGSGTRSLYIGGKSQSQTEHDAERWPWDLYLREGSEAADQWNLPQAAQDPLFGLPALPEQDLPESPYRHLEWFTRNDAEIFFGRGYQIRELYDRLTAPRSAPVMLFYGQSGVGKSSILDAGLIPRLQHDHDVRYLRRNQNGLLETLKSAFASGEPVESAWRTSEEQSGKPLIVFLDQVEELFTRPISAIPDELGDLLAAIKAIFVDSGQRPRGKLVLGFRKEWLAELEAQFVENEIPRTKVFLEPLDRRGIIEVVQGPSKSERLRQRYGLTVENVLPDTIADDLSEDRDSAIAPTLQILLTKMWINATKKNYDQPKFTQDLYRRLKRDGILLRDFLNQQIESFRERYPEAVDSGLLLDIVALHTTPLGTADRCSVEELQAQYSHLGSTLPDLLQQCQDLHLLTVTADKQKDSTKTTRLAHDTLAPLVRERFDESDKPGQRARRILDNRSVDWSDDGVGTPLDEADLLIVEQGTKGTRSLNPTEQRLLEASRELRNKLRRTRLFVRIGAAVATLAIISVSVFAILKSGEAQQANVTALLTASPAELPETFKSLSQSTVPTFRGLRDDSSRLFTPRLHSAFALAHLKDPEDESLAKNDRFLVENLADVPENEMSNLLSALSAEPEQAILDQLSEIASGSSDDSASQTGVKAAAVLVALGKLDRLDSLLVRYDSNNARAADPRRRTEFVHGYHRWIGDPAKLRELLAKVNVDPSATDTKSRVSIAALAAICQSLTFCNDSTVRESTQETLKKFAIEHDAAAVRAASLSTLKSWQIELDNKPDSGHDWQVNTVGLTMVAVPFDANGEGRFTWLDVKNQQPGSEVPKLKVLLTRPFRIADTEVTTAQWALWPDRPNDKEQWSEAVGTSSPIPRGYVRFYDALKFCNWLSEKENLTACYKLVDEEENEWACDFEANGYRLPTEAEWRFSCRGGSNATFCFGDDLALLDQYAWTVGNSDGKAGLVATRIPNSWGLFDMHGNMLEWCWDWYEPPHHDQKLLVDPMGPPEPNESFFGRTACGGHFGTGSEYAIADDRGNFGARDLQRFLGFRVVQTIKNSNSDSVKGN